jgi:hypothetical protein
MTDPQQPPNEPFAPPAGGAPGPPPAQYGYPPPQTQYGYPPQPYQQQPHGYGGYPPHRRTNGMAIASMVLGIVWIWWIGSVLALVFGYIARSQIRERGESGAGMAIAGIVLGWIGVGFFLLFVMLGVAGAFDA